MITAPFNFVPLSEKVFFPPWADEVSHDIPFEDGESGTIDITITAKSPIFIRDHANPEHFCSHNGEYYIPSTSVKGMVRSVLEIMSFSKMSQFDDDTYAVRDLSKADNFYMKQMNLIDEPFTQCGWLKIVDGKYLIEDCGMPQRISHREIDKATGKNFSEKFERNGFEKTSEFKYNILGQTHQIVRVGEPYVSTTNAKYDKRLFCRYDKNGKEGTLVVTGQPTVRKNTGKMGDGKGYEFIFLNSSKELKVSEKNMKDFLFAYFDKRDTQPKESPDWTYWKKKLENGEKVPVFFQKNENQVAHFGLSYLYKLPYKHSVKDGIPAIHFDKRKDLAQSIFGYANKDDALKGRVQFSHFKAVENVNELHARTEILGTPRASYYPMYVRQYNTNFKTFMDGNFSISGWKRYPIHRGSSTTPTEDTGNENVGTTFAPLQTGVVFKGKLRYHNLKKAELGAILSALTFHGTQNTFHNIGMAKPLGYGKIEIELKNISHIEEYLKIFELEISQQITDWRDAEQLKELLSMSVEQNNNQGNSQLEYMSLEKFANNKSKTKDYLRHYTALDNINSIHPTTLLSDDEIKRLDDAYKKFKEKEVEFLANEKAKKEHNEMFNLLKSTDNIAQIDSFMAKYPNSIYLEKVKKIKKKIEFDKEVQKMQEIQKEADEKWIKVLGVENRYKVEALKKFIQDYPSSLKINDAKKELESLMNSKKSDTNISSIDTLSSAKDSKQFKSILEENKDILDTNMETIKDNAIRIYKSLKGKKQKNFFKEIQLGRFLGKDFEDEVKKIK